MKRPKLLQVEAFVIGSLIVGTLVVGVAGWFR